MRPLILASLTLVFAACSHVAHHDSCEPGWNYDEQQLWPPACNTGPDRSPINITTTTTASYPRIEIQDAPFFPRMYNNKRGVKFYANNGGGSVRVTYANETKVFTLQEFHFHVPGEHTFNGTPAPMELHLVYQDATAKPKVVVAILFDDTGGENQELREIIRIQPRSTCTYVTSTVRINPRNLLPPPPSTMSYYYRGALTTPNCDPGLEFFVFLSRTVTNRSQIAGIASVTPTENAKTYAVRPLPGIPIVPVVPPR